MITKAIIESVESDGYHFKVRIPVYHKIAGVPGSTPYEELPDASCCVPPGIKPNYSIGDVVWITFENNQYSDPVIMGMLYNDKMMESTSTVKADSLTVEIDAHLPNTI